MTIAFRCDVIDAGSIERDVETVASRAGVTDVVVVVAGVAVTRDPPCTGIRNRLVVVVDLSRTGARSRSRLPVGRCRVGLEGVDDHVVARLHDAGDRVRTGLCLLYTSPS